MTSHGVARTSRFRTDEQRQQDHERIEKYRHTEETIRNKISKSQYDQETFQLTSKILRLNPEYYTIWNARRRCLISGLLSKPSAGLSHSKVSLSTSATDTLIRSSDVSSPFSSTEIPQAPNLRTAGKSGIALEKDAETTMDGNESEQQDIEIIRAELSFTIPLLMEFPKCYWIWHYRQWVLRQASLRLTVGVARRIWQEELGLVGKMLTKDRRNFHAWGYRRHVVTQLESLALDEHSLVESEFEYTTNMIHVDLSNFSAWHNRSQLIPRLLKERKADGKARKEFLDKELDNIREALNVGPEDQSLWFYHQYLILNLTGMQNSSSIAPHLTVDERKAYILREISDIKDLLEDYFGIKWIYEALVEYTAALWQLSGHMREGDQLEMAAWLGKLKLLDPMRNGRWCDLARRLNLEPSN